MIKESSIWPTKPREYRVETQLSEGDSREVEIRDISDQWQLLWRQVEPARTATAVNAAYRDRRVAFCRRNKRSTDDFKSNPVTTALFSNGLENIYTVFF